MTIIQSPYPEIDIAEISITERLFRGLDGQGDAVVLTDGPTGRTLTAAGLEQAIRRLAGGLKAHGLQKGDVVALMAPNIPEYAVVFHAVAFAGGIVTTINPTYTAYEVEKQLKASGAKMLITVPAFVDTAEEAASGTKVGRIAVIGGAGDMGLDALMGDPLDAQVPVDLERDVVVLPYSSGTTGLPKGVMLSHRNMVANVDQTLAVLPIARGEATVAFLPFFHIYGMNVLMNAFLAGGGALVTMPRFDLEMFLTLVARHATPKLYTVPPVVLALAKHPMVDAHDMSAVAQLICGAAPLGGDVADAAAARLGAVTTQAYGMTELSPVSHATPIETPRSGASGVPLPNTACRIVNFETGADCAPGDEGELWVKGPQVMLGYLDNDAATRATITDDGWLRTGDLTVADKDGFFFIRERVKELIKVKGFQVAPAELEAELLAHPEITDVAVVGKPDDEAGEVPMAFVVRAAGSTLDADAVSAFIAARLSSYKVPRDVRFVDEVPKSASGKILRRVLRDQIA
ncbi:AMP-binding protein [Maribius pontilimi]|uniref:AMP-binding protein n=1 Tax=Palleronia pontilimi TaxID=1964209 RepID=A0A934IHF5_9RHOB|nr:AMP-binding protein [Palleronia pontilimi]MBJ3762650.1 AMP-binding protein [Palleronia pontilimi]